MGTINYSLMVFLVLLYTYLAWISVCFILFHCNLKLKHLIYIIMFAITFPFWDQRGGSSWPRGNRPVSRQERKARRWPPGGKCSGGRWIPSWLTRTSVPPQSAGIYGRDTYKLCVYCGTHIRYDFIVKKRLKVCAYSEFKRRLSEETTN